MAACSSCRACFSSSIPSSRALSASSRSFSLRSCAACRAPSPAFRLATSSSSCCCRSPSLLCSTILRIGGPASALPGLQPPPTNFPPVPPHRHRRGGNARSSPRHGGASRPAPGAPGGPGTARTARPAGGGGGHPAAWGGGGSGRRGHNAPALVDGLLEHPQPDLRRVPPPERLGVRQGPALQLLQHRLHPPGPRPRGRPRQSGHFATVLATGKMSSTGRAPTRGAVGRVGARSAQAQTPSGGRPPEQCKVAETRRRTFMHFSRIHRRTKRRQPPSLSPARALRREFPSTSSSVPRLLHATPGTG